MAIISVVFKLVIILVASANVACSQRTPSFNIKPTVIEGYNGTCPLEHVNEQARQNVSSELKNILSCRYRKHRDCQRLLESSCHTSGVYTIQPDDMDPFEVYCDMETEGGGWTVFQRRQDGSVNFFRRFDEYVAGFGDRNGEFWLGLEAIHRLAPTQLDRSVTTLRVDLRDSQDNPGNATFETFGLLNSTSQYELNVGRYSGGNAGDSLTVHSGSLFFTYDRDAGHEAYNLNCASKVNGAWWFRNTLVSHVYVHLCSSFHSHLNGLHSPNANTRSGIQWLSFTGRYEALSFSEMKLRRRTM